MSRIQGEAHIGALSDPRQLISSPGYIPRRHAAIPLSRSHPISIKPIRASIERAFGLDPQPVAA
jgi:hypothetical protein